MSFRMAQVQGLDLDFKIDSGFSGSRSRVCVQGPGRGFRSSLIKLIKRIFSKKFVSRKGHKDGDVGLNIFILDVGLCKYVFTNHPVVFL